MSRDQRVHDNFALLAAQHEALEHHLPLLVVFNILPRVGVRAKEHFAFMIDGLKQVEIELQKHSIPLLLTIGQLPEQIEKLSNSVSPRTVYFDFNPLRTVREAQKQAAARLSCRVAVVDTHNIVPVWVLSDKQEFAAHTIRRKLHKTLPAWIEEPQAVTSHPYSFGTLPSGATWKEVDEVVARQPSAGISHGFSAGERAAQQQLETFIATGLVHYSTNRNDPTIDGQSDLSPYLHFGQLSALRIVLEILKSAPDHTPLLLREARMPSHEGVATREDSIDAFIEELVVRRELSDNFCFYNTQYDSLAGAPQWALDSLALHEADPREYIYSRQQFEQATTHDLAWNAAQIQLTKTGKMHGYMRMYWAKKLLEWSESPKDAVETAVYLNDHYGLDGGDPNGYAGILWSIAGLHDRPWFERSIYGKVRYMNASGLSRKFAVDQYIQRWPS